MSKKEKEIEWNKAFGEYYKSIQDLTSEIMKKLTPAIKEATENIKKMNEKNIDIEDIEIIQDEENEKDT